jgi:hypothetical protein
VQRRRSDRADAEVPKRLLRGFQGFLQTDGYEGYTALGAEPGIVHVGCWAHTRRKFSEALRGQGKSRKEGTKRAAKESRARQALSQIQALYRIERELQGASPEERHAARQVRSKPLVETAKANRIEPSRYLAHLFEVLPMVNSTDQLQALLPQNLELDVLNPR